MPVTIKDIALRANVSPSTVSRALRDHPHISAETKEQIKKLALEMGYVPSEVARSLVGQQSATIGVAIADFQDPFYSSLLSGIEDVAVENHTDLFVGSFYRDLHRERKLFDAFDEKRLAGIIVAGSLVDEAYLARPLKSIPAVLINCPIYPFSVSVDQVAGACLAMEHLLSLGHQKVAYVSLGAETNSNNQRLAGYQKVLMEHRIPIDDALIVDGDGTASGGILAVQQLLSLAQYPTAIFCYNDMTAIGVMKALNQHGLSIPHDVSVIGFDGLEIGSYSRPPLTTIEQPIYDLGHQAATMLFRLIEDGEQAVTAETLEPALIVRGSTAPLKGGGAIGQP